MDKERSYNVQKGREKNRYRWMVLEDKCKLQREAGATI